MKMSKSDQKDFISSVLSTQEAYKVKSKAYLSAIQKNDKDIIAFIITVASTILTNKKKHDPMVFLNILRVIFFQNKEFSKITT